MVNYTAVLLSANDTAMTRAHIVHENETNTVIFEDLQENTQFSYYVIAYNQLGGRRSDIFNIGVYYIVSVFGILGISPDLDQLF